MAVEAIQKVTEIEQETKRRKEETVLDSKQRILVAQRAAQRLLEESRIAAEAESRQMVVQAEAQAAQETRKTLEQAAQACQAMKHAARQRLDAAAQLIVEKVVND